MTRTHESVDLVGDDATRHLAFAALIAALTAALAQVSIPLPGLPAPISFQMFGVYVAGLLLGPLWGGLAITLYLLVGVAGAPVFSNGGAGLAYLLGPKGGYLVGFLLAAVLIGAIVHRSVEPTAPSSVPVPVQAGALVAGLALIYATGVPWLAYTTAYDLSSAATVGMLVFLPGDLIKIVAVLGLLGSGALSRGEPAAGA